jgi:hypothetical protein
METHDLVNHSIGLRSMDELAEACLVDRFRSPLGREPGAIRCSFTESCD